MLLCLGCERQPTLTIFAASSLTEVFETLVEAFEAEHSDIEVALSFGGSSTLATQIIQGAQADLFASANAYQLQRLRDQNLSEPPVIFAYNTLTIITPATSDLHHVTDLATPSTLIVVASEDVPIGHYTYHVMANLTQTYGAAFTNALTQNIVSEESNVRQVSAKVVLGEADAAFVYATDALTLDHVRTISLSPELNVQAVYPVAVLTEAPHKALAQTFIRWLLSPKAQTILEHHGFQTPLPASP